MKEKIAAWQLCLENASQQFEAEFGKLNAKQLDWKPNPETWSIAQNMNHLITINESYYPAVHAVRDGSYKRPFWGRFGFYRKMMGDFILKSVQPDRKKKIKTFLIWEPGSSDLGADILPRFLKHQQEMAQFIASCEDLLEAGAAISSPASRVIVYNLETAFDIITQHEFRHLAQACEILELLRNDD
jgi:hypothetical protein